MSSFRGCLSGSSELGWGSVELLRTSDGRVFCLMAHFVLASASTWRFGYFMFFGFQWLSFRERVGCPWLSSWFVTLCSGISLALRLAGFIVPARPTRDKSQWENVRSCGGGQVFLVRLGGASLAVRAVHIATGCSVKVGSSISVFFWLRLPGQGGAGSRS